MPNWYSGNKLLSMLDMNGEEPEIFISNSNRSAGKSTFFNKWCVEEFIKGNGKFMLIYRYKNELSDISSKFFNEIGRLFFSGYIMTHISRANGSFMELFLRPPEGEPVSCGFAVALSSASKLKLYSHFFTEVKRMIFDEYQVESIGYMTNEIVFFHSLHQTVARGEGFASRYVPVVLIGNQLSTINPYYSAFGITERLQKDTKFLRGRGWVVEQNLNKDVRNIQRRSAFEQAFVNNEYLEKQGGGDYLNDITSFIDKRPEGRFYYQMTIKYMDKYYSVSMFPDSGILYVDNKYDKTFKNLVAVTTDQHDINIVMLRQSDIMIKNYREFFDRGCVRFKNINCKTAFMELVKYR